MTKSQLIDRIAEKLPSVPRRDVEQIVNTVFDSMVEALRQERRIEIRGFGSFGVKIREAREGRNPKTGQKVAVPRRRTPFFTVGKELRERLNGGAIPASRESERDDVGSSYSGGGSANDVAPMPMVAAPHK